MPDTHRFQEEFDAFKARLLGMGGLAEEQVRVAVRALVEREPDDVQRILTGDEPLNRLQVEIDDRGFRLLA